MNELNASRFSLSVHTIAGIIAGYVSYLLNNMFNNKLYVFGVMILILLITGYLTEFALKKKGIKWWLSNGAILYIFVWLISWIFLFNM
jgi:F0F1-type ATP synthase assembly protein I